MRVANFSAAVRSGEVEAPDPLPRPGAFPPRKFLKIRSAQLHPIARGSPAAYSNGWAGLRRRVSVFFFPPEGRFSRHRPWHRNSYNNPLLIGFPPSSRFPRDIFGDGEGDQVKKSSSASAPTGVGPWSGREGAEDQRGRKGHELFSFPLPREGTRVPSRRTGTR